MRLVAAGADDITFSSTIVSSDHPNLLTSYYHAIRGKSPVALEKWRSIYNVAVDRGAFWIMDSGLFTMMFGAGKGKSYNREDLFRYTHTYIDTMQEIDYRSSIVEMDVHKVLGLDSLKEFRSIFEQRWPLDRTIYVWHIEEKLDGLERLAERYPFIAISIPELRIVTQSKRQLAQLLSHAIARANKVNPDIRIHLLGCTQQDLLMQSGYFSCDSTSWLGAGKFANGILFRHNRMLPAHTRSQPFQQVARRIGPLFHKRMETLGIELSEARKTYMLNNAVNIHAYRQMNQYVNSQYFKGEAVPSLWHQ
jgi:hypothetical protein